MMIMMQCKNFNYSVNNGRVKTDDVIMISSGFDDIMMIMMQCKNYSINNGRVKTDDVIMISSGF